MGQSEVKNRRRERVWRWWDGASAGLGREWLSSRHEVGESVGMGWSKGTGWVRRGAREG